MTLAALDETANTSDSLNRLRQAIRPDQLRRMPWPASIGLGGRLQPDSAAAFIGMRSLPATRLQEGLEPRLATQRIEVAVMARPLDPVTMTWQQVLQ
jgi:hypothetical protein